MISEWAEGSLTLYLVELLTLTGALLVLNQVTLTGIDQISLQQISFQVQISYQTRPELFSSPHLQMVLHLIMQSHQEAQSWLHLTVISHQGSYWWRQTCSFRLSKRFLIWRHFSIWSRFVDISRYLERSLWIAIDIIPSCKKISFSYTTTMIVLCFQMNDFGPCFVPRWRSTLPSLPRLFPCGPSSQALMAP